MFSYVPSTVIDAHQRLGAGRRRRRFQPGCAQRVEPNVYEAVRLVDQALVRSQSRVDIERDVSAAWRAHQLQRSLYGDL